MMVLRAAAVVLGAGMLLLAGCADDDAAKTAETGGGGSNGVCLQTSQIDHTEIVDDSTILFKMRDGKPYVNKLRFPCTNLKMEGGFAFETDSSEICSASETIHVLRAGNFCELGQFTPYEAAGK